MGIVTCDFCGNSYESKRMKRQNVHVACCLKCQSEYVKTLTIGVTIKA